jgi:hypothetical protein
MGELRVLPPEPWGRRLRRVREDVGGFNMEQATAEMARYLLVSTASISRLEGLAEIPGDPRQLRTAFVLCLICGVDPAELGLAPKDSVAALPGAVRDALGKDFPALSIGWLTARPLASRSLAA